MRAQLRTVVVVLVVVGDIILRQSNTQKYHRQSPRISLAHLARARRTPPIILVARALKTLMRSIARARFGGRARWRSDAAARANAYLDRRVVFFFGGHGGGGRRASGKGASEAREWGGGTGDFWWRHAALVSLSLRARAQRTKKDGLILLWIDATG
jgi:hypothetical protein